MDSLHDGWYRVTELEPADGYELPADPAQTFYLKAGESRTIIVKNTPLSALAVWKYDSVTGQAVEGAVFQVNYLNGGSGTGGTVIGTWRTSANGSFTVTGLKKGTYIVTEVASDGGHVIDAAPQTVHISGEQQDVVQLYFGNSPKGAVLIKKIDSVTREPLSGVEFYITDSSGAVIGSANGKFVTDSAGTILISDVVPGITLVVKETRAKPGYVLDETTQTVRIKSGETAALEFRNQPMGGLELIKVSEADRTQRIPGVAFEIHRMDGGLVETVSINKTGRVYVPLEAGETSLVEWQNTPVTGQIQIFKTSADDNPTNGWPAGSPIPGTVFEIYDWAGNLADTVQTGKNGVAASKPLPLGRYKVIETKAADFYLLDKTPITAEIEFAGQIVRLAMTNRSVSTGVSIAKRGYGEVMPGQNLRYTFSGIANTSNVSLSSFYWRDTLPIEAVRLAQITTGTYNVAGSYKVVYRTNLSGDEYRTLSDNLSTQHSYMLPASPLALGLASNEYVTEVMFVFGVVPAGFRQVEAPIIDCTVLSGLTNGLQFVNRADVGGIYDGKWVQGTAWWTTRVYAPTKPQTLPRTGY